ncbi:general substrate transporter [Heliocybe sulcata]|uniref:General substrate transporter n=1 Tax=Heliocybe sulcata TaxID=5364 RepID=A0A5C3MPQ5_9AGAM|nr:general substrate transporter [Heliocybe sulcata]
MAELRDSQRFTFYGWIACIWILVVSFQYGYHISALNQIQAVLTCRKTDGVDRHYGMPTCIPMTDATFSVVTSVFTVGGLLGSMGANIIMDKRGRKDAVRASSLMTAAGTSIMALSSSVYPLAFGRILVGIGAGIGICVGPVFLGEISPAKIKGNVGVLTQLAIVFGILFTQSAGFRLATSTEWRMVFLLSCALSIADLLASPLMIESPIWLSRSGRVPEVKNVTRRLWGTGKATDGDAEDPLLPEDNHRSRSPDDRHESTVTIPRLLVAPDLRKPLTIVCLAMISQQISGVNAVLYYSNAILSKSLPDFGPYVSLGITVVNAIMTFPPVFLIERMGRKQLMTISSSGAIASLVLVGVGLDYGVVALSSVAIMTFIMSFAVGMGPVPFIIISDVSPPHAVSAISSVALSLNWITNFAVGLVFLPLRNLLSGGNPEQEGRVFYAFALVFLAFVTAFSRAYRE